MRDTSGFNLEREMSPEERAAVEKAGEWGRYWEASTVADEHDFEDPFIRGEEQAFVEHDEAPLDAARREVAQASVGAVDGEGELSPEQIAQELGIDPEQYHEG